MQELILRPNGTSRAYSRTLLGRGLARGGQAEGAPGVFGVGGVMKMGYGDGTSLGAGRAPMREKPDGQAAKHASTSWRRGSLAMLSRMAAWLLFRLGFRIPCAKRIYRFLLPVATRRSFSAPSENQGHLSAGFGLRGSASPGNADAADTAFVFFLVFTPSARGDDYGGNE